MLHEHELIIDSFAGGGGASTGIELALGRSPDIAINHDGCAMTMHLANHPDSVHYIEDIWQVDPAAAVRGCAVGLLWASPDCSHFSKAKNNKPKENDIRGLAWAIARFARKTKPRVIVVENVEEFEDWGPLDKDGFPIKERAGETFKEWQLVLRAAGYEMELRQLKACDYGAPTTRKRLFVIARRDGRPITWPKPTHGPGLKPYRTAAECIDWSVPARSIFGRKKDLADATCRRIAHGLVRHVIQADDPFIVPEGYAPTMIQTGYGERPTQRPRYLDLHKPLGTIMAKGNKHALVAAWITKHYTGVVGHDLRRPFGTVTTRDHHSLTVAAASRPDNSDEVRAFLIKYFGTGVSKDLRTPLDTITTRDRFGLVVIEGEEYLIKDIGMRMLTPRELYTAQGFPADYVIDPIFNGKPMTKTQQIHMCGNSVSPPLASALVASQFPAAARAWAAA